MTTTISERDRDTAQRLRDSDDPSYSITDKLTTNERVIARVTDGIYRQPASAVRELIANAYDADASRVSIRTDAPRFSRIVVEDDGHGMTPDSVIHLLHNIGGSAKRTEQGQELGITSTEDSTRTPGGRQLIGKLGIGIFSVSQLTHSFQIITKTKNDLYRTVVLVNLKQFADEASSNSKDSEKEFQAGSYKVWRELTSELNSHGTTIVLNSIRPQTRDTLRSEQLWSAIDSAKDEDGLGKGSSVIPQYHIGRLDNSGSHVADKNDAIRSLPWDDTDNPELAFKKMVDSVWSFAQGRSSAKLANLFDTYLQMIWELSLALPLPYIEKNIFDETVSDDWASFYILKNGRSGSAERLTSNKNDETLSELTNIHPSGENLDHFEVIIDNVQLSRPIKFRGLPKTQHALKRPLVFVGSVKEDFAGFSRDVSAGPLHFSAYLIWTPKIAPAEHQGALVRIRGASGTLFDSTFLNYQVAELTRLRQITCEIFVSQGMEAALNIDRESFNTAHPHTVVLTKWLHNALRQLATAQKREAQLKRAEAKLDTQRDTENWRSKVVQYANEYRTSGEGIVPNILFNSSKIELKIADDEVTHAFDLEHMLQVLPSKRDLPPKQQELEKLADITKLLSIYGCLDELSSSEQENLLGSILGILDADNYA